MTKEHLWPEWLRNALPEIELALHRRKGPSGGDDLRVAPPFSVWQRIVDYRCNHGWMGRLETRCAPQMKPMVRGQRTSLGKGAQERIALWVVKTAMTLQYTNQYSNPDTIPSDHYRYVGRFKKPPPGMVVHIGACAIEPQSTLVGTEVARYIVHRVPEFRYPGYDARRDGYFYTVTMSVGNLAMHILANSSNFNVKLEFNGPLGDAMRRIHPPLLDSLNWPFDLALDNSTFESLSTFR